MRCYRVRIPDGAKVPGVTAGGRRTAVLPGEYLVHELPAKVPGVTALFRFVGADVAGHDVHVPLAVFRPHLANASHPESLPQTETA